jgi:hypothetical protein
VIALVLVALVAAGIAERLITTAVFLRLSRVRRAMDSLSSGNGGTLAADGKDELTSEISRSFNQFVNQIAGIHETCPAAIPSRFPPPEIAAAQPGPVGPHRAAGRCAGRNRLGHGRTDLDRTAELGERAPRQ